MKKIQVVCLLAILTVLISCSRIKEIGGQSANSGDGRKDAVVNPKDAKKKVNVPSDMQNSSPDAGIYKETSAIVSITKNPDILYGLDKKAINLSEFGEKIELYYNSQKDAPNDAKLVYVAADAENEYGLLVRIFEMSRRKKFEKVKLVVSAAKADDANNVFEANLSEEPGDQPQKTNPLTLVVSMEKDGKLKLNMNEETLGSLSARLKEIFRNREENGVFRERTNEIYKPVIVKGFDSAKYGEVINIINALQGAGASPIILQIDDLSD